MQGERSKEPVSFGKITATSREEETCSETVLVVKSSGNRTSDSGLASAGHAIQPKDTFVVRVVAPHHQLLEQIDSGIGETLRLLLT